MSRHRTLRKKLLDSESEDEDEYYQEEVEFTPPKAAKSKSKASSRRQQSKTGESLSWTLKKRIIEAIDNPLSPGNLCDICDRSPDIFGAKASALRRSVQRFVDNFKRKKTAEAAQLFRDKVFRKAAIEAESANPFESLDLTSAPFTQYRTPCSPTSSPEVEKKPMSSRTPRKKTPTRNNGRMSAHIMPGAPIPDNAVEIVFNPEDPYDDDHYPFRITSFVEEPLLEGKKMVDGVKIVVDHVHVMDQRNDRVYGYIAGDKRDCIVIAVPKVPYCYRHQFKHYQIRRSEHPTEPVHIGMARKEGSHHFNLTKERAMEVDERLTKYFFIRFDEPLTAEHFPFNLRDTTGDDIDPVFTTVKTMYMIGGIEYYDTWVTMEFIAAFPSTLSEVKGDDKPSAKKANKYAYKNDDVVVEDTDAAMGGLQDLNLGGEGEKAEAAAVKAEEERRRNEERHRQEEKQRRNEERQRQEQEHLRQEAAAEQRRNEERLRQEHAALLQQQAAAEQRRNEERLRQEHAALLQQQAAAEQRRNEERLRQEAAAEQLRNEERLRQEHAALLQQQAAAEQCRNEERLRQEQAEERRSAADEERRNERLRQVERLNQEQAATEERLRQEQAATEERLRVATEEKQRQKQAVAEECLRQEQAAAEARLREEQAAAEARRREEQAAAEARLREEQAVDEQRSTEDERLQEHAAMEERRKREQRKEQITRHQAKKEMSSARKEQYREVRENYVSPERVEKNKNRKTRKRLSAAKVKRSRRIQERRDRGISPPAPIDRSKERVAETQELYGSISDDEVDKANPSDGAREEDEAFIAQKAAEASAFVNEFEEGLNNLSE